MREALQQSAAEAAANAEGGMHVAAALWESAQTAAQESSQAVYREFPDAVPAQVGMMSAAASAPPEQRDQCQRDEMSQRRGPVQVQAGLLTELEEHDRQLQRAIVESMREDEQLRAAAQFEEASTLQGIIESLRTAPVGTQRARRTSPGPLIHALEPPE